MRFSDEFLYNLRQNNPMLGGVNVIKGTGVADGKSAEFTAIPYFALGNRGHEPYRTWLPIKQ